jgi:hypothetical protein
MSGSWLKCLALLVNIGIVMWLAWALRMSGGRWNARPL